ncbi:site-specific integrase [Lacticaseibacillus pabuli]|uniref:Site-specific integrase n=1 Tax=Lacticaseibacillus pabuli TaxID=3025672 RepID=A0ABY7WTV6_9LACO|nr:site-specific integrase [Lacticaseibacillus sp. KACC 23028]WDF83594.1 site-specific integrase [Lacticaseibacillus sp. KACC 23028]
MATFSKLDSGRWQYRVSVGSGKNRKRIKSSLDEAGNPLMSLKAAKLAANSIESRTLRGRTATGSKQSISDYFDNWIKVYKLGKHSASTDAWYHNVSGYIREYFDDTQLSTIDRMQWQQFINHLSTTPRSARKGPLSHSTILRVNNYMRAVAGEALEDGVITKDFTRHVDLGGEDSKPAVDKFLNQQEFIDILSLAAQRADMQHMSDYIIFAQGLLGTRFEETIGIAWDRIDWEHQTVRIDRSWNYKIKSQYGNFGGLKNKASYRTLPMSNDLAAMFKQLQGEQQDLYSAQQYTDPDNLVFRNFYHNVVNNNAVNDTLKRLCTAAKTHIKITSHGLRHTNGSVLLYNGVELIAVSRRLGHADMQTTIKTYAHEIHEMQMREDTKTAKVLDGLDILE